MALINIEIRHSKGDTIWMMHAGTLTSAVVVAWRIVASDNGLGDPILGFDNIGDDGVLYTIEFSKPINNQMYTYIKEDTEVFSTKEELINSVT